MKKSLTKFRYGGHATFPVRYGWLPKGLRILTERERFTANLDVADELGLGSKMVESLGFWLQEMGLTDDRSASGKARIIAENDPYFELPGTWWFLQIALVRNEETVWSWFFNDFNDRTFDRTGCIEAYVGYAKSNALRPPSLAAAQKDIGCLLSAYGARPGVDLVDPDDVGACPLRELALVVRDPTMDRFEKNRSAAPVPMEAFLASAALSSEDLDKESLSLRELTNARRGPGRTFGCNAERIDGMLSAIAATKSLRGAHVETLLGERHLRVVENDVNRWMTKMYARVGAMAA